MDKKTILFIYSALCVSFLAYSALLYRQVSVDKSGSELAAEGRLVFQQYNCQSCHQVFGLGGYLGPDLTNVLSEEGKGEVLVRTIVENGTRQMPGFALQEKEMQALLAFLKSTDEAGKADPRSFETTDDGMIIQK